MISEVIIAVQGVEHVLTGLRAQRFWRILQAKFEANPELKHAGRLARAQAEADAFRESEQSD